MTQSILLLEDDSFLREGLSEVLTKEGYCVTVTDSILSAKNQIEENEFDLMIFDVMLPDGNGIDLCREVRMAECDTPIIFLTAKDEEIQIVKGLDSGADDYITKPFKLLELLSRIRVVLRRKGTKVYKSKNIILDKHHFTVKYKDSSILLTPTEMQILSLIMEAGGNIVTRNMLLQNIWDDNNNFIDDNTLSVHISRLREKIGTPCIVTVRGVGYRWEELKGK